MCCIFKCLKINPCNYYKFVLTPVLLLLLYVSAQSLLLYTLKDFNLYFLQEQQCFLVRSPYCMNNSSRTHLNSFRTYHYVSLLQVLCFPPRDFQSPDSQVGSVCHCGELINWTELHDGNSVPALLAASEAPSLSSPRGMGVEGYTVTAPILLPAFPWVGFAEGRSLLKAGRRGCVVAEGLGCR